MRPIVRWLDALVRHAVGVYEFTRAPACILRLQRSVLHHPLLLPDGRLPSGTPVLEFHLWNERVPPLPAHGADLAWARGVSHRLRLSFQWIAALLPAGGGASGIQAVGCATVLGPASGVTADVLARLGFQPCPVRHPLGRFGEGLENAYAWALMWTYNPASLRGKRLGRLRRTEYWMSTPAFLERFAA